MSKRKIYYHTSGYNYRVGDIIGGPGKSVCLHIKPVPHYSIQEMVDAGHRCWSEYSKQKDEEMEKYFHELNMWNSMSGSEKPEPPTIKSQKKYNLKVYRVKPYKDPLWNGINDEYRAYNTFVEIIGIEGNAKGILNNLRKKIGKEKACWLGGTAKKRE